MNPSPLLLCLIYAVAASVLAGPAIACALAMERRRTANETVSVAASLIGPGLLAYTVFFLYLLAPALGRIVAVTAVAGAWMVVARGGANYTSRSSAFVRPASVALALGVFYLALLYLPLLGQTYINQSVYRFVHPLPSDPTLPLVFGDRLFTGAPVRPFAGDWLSSDRPPLQAGFYLLALPFFRLTRLPDELGYQCIGTLVQLFWVPAVWLIARAFGQSRARSFTVVLFVGSVGVFILNSVYVWPKLIASAYVAIAGGLFLTADAENPGDAYVLAAFAAALGWLSHGSVGFSLLAFVPFTVARLRRHPRQLLLAAAAFVLLALPWLWYQKFYDPPGDRLLKWHLAGVIAPDSRSLVESLRTAYGGVSWQQWLNTRMSNVRLIVSGSMASIIDLASTSPKQRRYDEFFFLVRAFGVLNLAWPVGIFNLATARCTGANRRLLLQLIGWTTLTLIVWVVLMFAPASTLVHQGSHVVFVVGCATAVVVLLDAPRWLGWPILAWQAVYFTATWLPYYGTAPVNTGMIALMILAAIALGVIVHPLSRDSNDQGTHASPALKRTAKALALVMFAVIAVRACPVLPRAPWVFWSIATLSTLVWVGSIVALMRNPSRRTFLLWAGATLALFAAWRWPFIVGPAISNPDEAQIVAGALTLVTSPRYWVAVDGTTHGPLVELPLVIAGWLGLPLDYATARAAGTLLVAAGWLLAAFGLMRRYAPAAVCIGLAPVIFWTASISFYDVTAYTSEVSAVALMLAALWPLLSGFVSGIPFRRRCLWLAPGAALLGAVPYAKLQAVPIAATGGLLCLVVLAGERATPARTRIAAVLVTLGGALLPTAGVALLPTAGVALYLAVIGGFHDFWTAYIVDNLVYVQTGALTWGGMLDDLPRYTHLAPGLPTLCGATLVVALLSGASALRSPLSSARRRDLVVAVSLLGVCLYATLAPLRTFGHYLQFLAMGVGLAGAVFTAVLWEQLEPRFLRWRAALSVVFVGLSAAALGSARIERPDPDMVVAWTAPQAARWQPTTDALRQLARPGDTLSVWGWMPYFYVETGLPQATREAHTYRQIQDPMAPYYRTRFLRDFQAHPPRFFVDAVGGDNFGYNRTTPQLRHESFPALSALIARDYALDADLDGTRIYVRKL